MLKQDPADVFDDFIDDIDEAISYSNLVPYEWSDELAHSASMLLEDMDGCNLIPDQIVDDQTSRYYIDMIAKYDDHRRMVMIPRKFEWDSIQEQIWELFLDEETQKNRYALMNNHFDSIGLACNCNTEFGQICILELGKNVRPIGLKEFDESVFEWDVPSFQSEIDWHVNDYKRFDGECQPEMPRYYGCL